MATCGTWPSRIRGWMPPWWSGGSPPWHDGSGAGTGQEGSDPVVFPCSHRPRPPEPATTHPRVCGVLGASLAKQTHPRLLSISAMSPSPLSPQYHPTPWLLSQIHMSHSGSPKRGCPLHVTPSPAATPWRWPWHPQTRGDTRQVLPGCDLGGESRGKTSPSCGQGHTGTVGTSPGLQGQVRRDKMTAGSGEGRGVTLVSPSV